MFSEAKVIEIYRNPPLKWNLSTTGNLPCFKLYRTHVKIGEYLKKCSRNLPKNFKIIHRCIIH